MFVLSNFHLILKCIMSDQLPDEKIDIIKSKVKSSADK